MRTVNLVPELELTGPADPEIYVDINDAVARIERNTDYVLRSATDPALVEILDRLADEDEFPTYSDEQVKRFLNWALSAVLIRGVRRERDRRLTATSEKAVL